MRLTIHECTPIDLWVRCAQVAAEFDREYPAPHRDCGVIEGGVQFYVTRTRAGGMAVRAQRTETP